MKPFYMTEGNSYVPKRYNNKNSKKENTPMSFKAGNIIHDFEEKQPRKISNFEKRFPGKKPMLNMGGLKEYIFDSLASHGIYLPDGHIPDNDWSGFMENNRQYLKNVDSLISAMIENLSAGEQLRICTEETVIQKSGTGTHSAKNNTGNGSKTIPISATEITGKYSIEKLSKVRGTRGKGSAKNPEVYDNYKQRIQCNRSRWRAYVFKETGEFVYSEEQINEITNIWTMNYNLKFGTNFAPYYSKRGYGPVRDGKKKK